MQRKHTQIAFLLAITAVVLSLSPAVDAQSMPAGQVSHRMATRPAKTNALPSQAKAIQNAKQALQTAAKADVSADTSQVATVSDNDRDADTKANDAAKGSAAKAFWSEVLKVDNTPGVPTAVRAYLLNVSGHYGDWMSRDFANQALKTDIAQVASLLGSEQYSASKCSNSDLADLAGANAQTVIAYCATQRSLQDIQTAIRSTRCWASTTQPATAASGQQSSSTTPTVQYDYQSAWMPLQGCDNDSVKNFFSVSNTTEAASNVKYLYNPQLSTSQLSGQLLTTTFNPGPHIPAFQLVLSSTATSGSSQSSPSGNSSGSIRRRDTTAASSTTPTDSTATAMAKIEAGGDFNLSVPMPWLYKANDTRSISGLFVPNFGFNINGFSGQNTLTESTEYNVNLPAELYAQIYSVEKSSAGLPAASIFVDLKPSGEWISPALAKALSPDTSSWFFLGQGSVGVEFAQSIRISAQYIYSQKKILIPNTATGSTLTPAQGVNGFHIAVSFSPQNAKKSANQPPQ